MADKVDKNIFRGLCVEAFGVAPSGYELLPGSGGDRIYFRLTLPDHSVLGVVADNLMEAKAYCRLSQSFLSCRHAAGENFHVPQVYAATPDYSHYLVEDMGNVALSDKLDCPGTSALVMTVLHDLTAMQTLPSEGWADYVAYPPLSERLIFWDLNYFKYEFLKNSGVDFDEDALEDDFCKLAKAILSIPRNMWGFMMRDCQSRNVILAGENNEVPYFIDFQGGRLGPLLYDAVSLLWQAMAGFSDSFRREMLEWYAGCLGKLRNVSPESILSYAGVIALFRTLQVLGAYGFRGLVQKRTHFLMSIPGALANLKGLLDNGDIENYPELSNVARRLAVLDRFKKDVASSGRLVVKVFSFSYKKGYPEDLSGNGGGFMFDCRGMHNPGRYDEYKPLTGRDKPVIDFLLSKGEAEKFAADAVELVSPTVRRYVRRGFSSLQIGFGCTGGRHRSVFCAEYAARELARKFPEVEVRLVHREQNIEEVFNRI